MIYYLNIATYLLFKYAYFNWSYMILAARLKDIFREAWRNGEQGNGDQIQTWGAASPVPDQPWAVCAWEQGNAALRAFALEQQHTLLPRCPRANRNMPEGWLPHYLHCYALSCLSQCFCLQPVTFGQVWDLPGLSAVVLGDKFLLHIKILWGGVLFPQAHAPASLRSSWNALYKTRIHNNEK